MGRNTLVERILEFDPPHTLAYDIEGLPKRLGRVTNRWTLAAGGAIDRRDPDQHGRNRLSADCNSWPNASCVA